MNTKFVLVAIAMTVSQVASQSAPPATVKIGASAQPIPEFRANPSPSARARAAAAAANGVRSGAVAVDAPFTQVRTDGQGSVGVVAPFTQVAKDPFGNVAVNAPFTQVAKDASGALAVDAPFTTVRKDALGNSRVQAPFVDVQTSADGTSIVRTPFGTFGGVNNNRNVAHRRVAPSTIAPAISQNKGESADVAPAAATATGAAAPNQQALGLQGLFAALFSGLARSPAASPAADAAAAAVRDAPLPAAAAAASDAPDANDADAVAESAPAAAEDVTPAPAPAPAPVAQAPTVASTPGRGRRRGGRSNSAPFAPATAATGRTGAASSSSGNASDFVATPSSAPANAAGIGQFLGNQIQGLFSTLRSGAQTAVSGLRSGGPLGFLRGLGQARQQVGRDLSGLVTDAADTVKTLGEVIQQGGSLQSLIGGGN